MLSHPRQPQPDRRRIEAVLAEIGSATLAVDANGRFDLETAIAYAKMPAHAFGFKNLWLVREPLHSARWPSDVVEYISPPVWGLGGNESYPDLFQPYGGFPDGVRVEDVTSPCPICRGSGSRAQRIFTPKCGG